MRTLKLTFKRDAAPVGSPDVLTFTNVVNVAEQPGYVVVSDAEGVLALYASDSILGWAYVREEKAVVDGSVAAIVSPTGYGEAPAKLILTMVPCATAFTSSPWAGKTVSVEFKGLVNQAEPHRGSELSIKLEGGTEVAERLSRAQNKRRIYKLTLEETEETF